MKKFLTELQWNDRTKLALAAIATGVALLFSMLFPLAFRAHGKPEEETATLRLEERAALFARYWSGAESTAAETFEIPDTRMTADCAAAMQRITERAIFDRKLADTGPDGMEYLSITENEQTVTVCHMWLERSGDWKNWMDVYFDAETGEIYYLYLSCGRLTDSASYAGVSEFDWEQAAEALTEYLDAALRYAAAEENGTHTAVLSTENGSICYRMECLAYDSLIDVKINCF